MEITLPFLKQEVGAGDIVGGTLASVGITPERVTHVLRRLNAIAPDEECPCKKNKKALSDGLTFRPRPASWSSMEYPEMPPGWELMRTAVPASRPDVIVNFYVNKALLDAGVEKSSANVFYIWTVIAGKYAIGSAYCCTSVRATAEKYWNEQCR